MRRGHMSSYPIQYLHPVFYEWLCQSLEERGIPPVTPMLYYTPHGFLVAYVKDEIFTYTWQENDVTHYGTIPLGSRLVPVFFEPFVSYAP